MKFSTREDIEAPIAHVFAQIADFATFERMALRRGADVRRLDQGQVRTGSSWDVAFKFRGKDRKLRAVVSVFDAPSHVQIDTIAAGIDGITQIELMSLSPQRTRLAVSTELSAKSLSARLLLQSMKLAKANLTKRFKQRIAEMAGSVEERYRKGT
jgi:hypothetical protein